MKFKLDYIDHDVYSISPMYFLRKKFLFWYLPVFVTKIDTSPYNRTTIAQHNILSTQDCVRFITEGKISIMQWNTAPVWYFHESRKSTKEVKTFKFNALDEFIDEFAEKMI